MVVQECVKSEEIGDLRHEWIFDEAGLIRSKKDNTKCLTRLK